MNDDNRYYNESKIFTFVYNQQFSFRFTIIDNSCYSEYMIKFELLSYNNPVRWGMFDVSSIIQLNEELQYYIYKGLRKSSIGLEAYVLHPFNKMEGIFNINKEINEDCVLFFGFFTLDGVSKVENLGPDYIFKLNDILLEKFIDLIFDIHLRLPYF